MLHVEENTSIKITLNDFDPLYQGNGEDENRRKAK